MDKTDVAVVVSIVTVFAIFLSVIIVDVRHDTEHTYWTSDTKYEAIDEGIEGLVNNEIDSLVVTHPHKPGIVGYVYFRKE